MGLRALWPKKEAVREVLTEEVANKLGHDTEAGISRLARQGVQKKGSRNHLYICSRSWRGTHPVLWEGAQGSPKGG